MKFIFSTLFVIGLSFCISAQTSEPKLKYNGKNLIEISNLNIPLSPDEQRQSGCSDELETFSGTVSNLNLNATKGSTIVLKPLKGKNIFFNLEDSQIVKIPNYKKILPIFLAKGKKVKIWAYSCNETGKFLAYFVDRISLL